MIRSTVRVFDNFPKVTQAVERLAERGLEEASHEALVTIQGIWPHGGMHVVPVHGTESGFAAGVAAEKSKSAIAHFHDHGTLGYLGREPKRPRKRNYKLKKADGTPSGIKPKRFYAKGRTAGRRALIARISRGL